MTSCMSDSIKPWISEAEIVNIAIDFLFDDRSMSECRGHLRNEYDVDVDDLGRLLEKARREVRDCDLEFGSHVRF
jgi:hypothetical protein